MSYTSFTRTIALIISSAVTVFASGSATLGTGYSHVPVNFSVVPHVSSSGINTTNTGTSVAFNLLGGSHARLHGVEFGGVANLESDEVLGAQFSGCVNVVGGNVVGYQRAGVANVVRNNVHGVQVSEVVNAAGTLRGTQFACVANVTREGANGAQFAGIANANRNGTTGFQAAGIVNVAKGQSSAFQLGGIANIADDINGAQFSLVNVAGNVKGLQLGLVNIADDIDGAAIGLFSYVKSVGLHYQFWMDELGLANAAIRGGGKHVYTLLTASLQADDRIDEDNFTWSLGYGIGARFDTKSKFFVNTDLLAQAIHYQDNRDEELNMIARYRIGGGWQFAEHFAVIGGFSANQLLSQLDDGSSFLPSWIAEGEKKGKTWHRSWPGVYLGVEW